MLEQKILDMRGTSFQRKRFTFSAPNFFPFNFNYVANHFPTVEEIATVTIEIVTVLIFYITICMAAACTHTRGISFFSAV